MQWDEPYLPTCLSSLHTWDSTETLMPEILPNFLSNLLLAYFRTHARHLICHTQSTVAGQGGKLQGRRPPWRGGRLLPPSGVGAARVVVLNSKGSIHFGIFMSNFVLFCFGILLEHHASCFPQSKTHIYTWNGWAAETTTTAKIPSCSGKSPWLWQSFQSLSPASSIPTSSPSF